MLLEGNRGTPIPLDTKKGRTLTQSKRNFQFEGFDDQSFFPFRKEILAILAISSLFLFILLYIFGGSNDTNTNIDDVTLQARMIFFLIGPLLSFLFYISLLLFLFFRETYRRTFKIIFEYAMIGGIVSILFALTLNTRAILLAIALSIEFDQEFGIFAFAAIIGPMIEEIGKGIPIYYLSKALITRENSEKEFRLLQNIRTPVMVGSLTGAIFNILETYWYIWNLGYLFELEDKENWQLVSSQIVLRSLNPLHLFTSAILGLGIGLAIWNTNRKVLLNENYSAGLFGFLVAVFFHGLWNGSLVRADEDTQTLELFGIELPLLNVFLIVVSLAGLIFLWSYISKFESVTCDFCDEWHKPPYEPEAHFHLPNISLSLTTKMLGTFRPQVYKCNFCQKVVSGKSCTSCNSKKLFTCGNCNATIPAHASTCWMCQKGVEIPFSTILDYPDHSSSTLSKPLVYILAGFYVPSSLAILVILSNSFSTAEEDSGLIDSLMIIFFFLLILGLTLVQIMRWLNNEYKYAMGYSLSRTIFSMMIIQFAILFLAVGIILMSLSQIEGSFLVGGFLFVVESLLIFRYAITVLLDFSPLFHEVRIERKNGV